MCEHEDELLRKKAFKAVEKLCQVQIPMFDGFMARTRDFDSVLKTVDGWVSWVRADCIILPEPTLEWQIDISVGPELCINTPYK